jgi:hypothetical protein
VPTLGAFLTGAGFEIEARYGDWHRGPLTEASREIITVTAAPDRPRDRARLQGLTARVPLAGPARAS